MDCVQQVYEFVVEDVDYFLLVDYVCGIIVDGDVELFVQLFINFIENVIVYMLLGIVIMLCLIMIDGVFVVEICDMGVGIFLIECFKVFGCFYRLDVSCYIEGVGLGFVLVVVIVLFYNVSYVILEMDGFCVRIMFLCWIVV